MNPNDKNLVHDDQYIDNEDVPDTRPAESPADSAPAPATITAQFPPSEHLVVTDPHEMHQPGAGDTGANPNSPPARSAEDNGEHDDLQIASLKAIFPDFDSSILHSVLESVGGDQDHAIDQLLGMSDPNYVSQAPPVQPVTQTELDEQLARRLMLEEEQEHQTGWQPEPVQQRSYQPRTRGRQRQQPQSSTNEQVGGKDTMADFQESFTKIAETGKKTFSSIVSKVKAKMQEFDQQRPGPGLSSGSTEPTWGSGAVGGNSYQNEPLAHESYYDPNPQYNPSPTPPSRPYQGYDAGPYEAPPDAPPREPPRPGSITPTPAVNTYRPDLTPSPRASSPSSDIGRPPQTSQGAPKIDYGKLGLLPKNPVSLLRDQPPATQARSRPTGSDEDDEELEYAKSPFEEGAK